MDEARSSYWSYSRITTYLSCSLSWFFRYISDEEPATVSSNLILGSAVHYGHELLYRGMKKGNIPAITDILEEVSEDILFRKKLNPPILFSNGGDIDSLIEEAWRLTECLYKSVKPEKIVSVDLEENVPLLENGEPILLPLKVIYDLIIETDDGDEVVIDLKSSRQRFQNSKLDWDLQPACYLYARGITGATNARRSFRYDVLLKNKTPKLIQYPTSRCQADFERLISIIKTVDRGVRNGVFMPNRGSYFCSTCEWERLCRDWRG
jgi:CRISPR/Cas system-associated exonuclease Cas4 (RecB family)